VGVRGGKWEWHWAFVPPVRPDLPAVADRAWAVNPIDRFVRARLQKEGLKPSPEADLATLIHRMSFDLTGLPPSPAEVDAFIHDRSPDAVGRLIVLRCLGIDHLKLTYKYQGRHVRQADVHGEVVKGVLALMWTV
jgi:Protein of unknown function (DUF1549)